MVKDLAFDASGRWLAFAGADSDVNVWDLAMVHDELAALGLAWDQAAPRSVSTTDLAAVGERLDHPVPNIWPGNIDPAEIEKAHRLLKSGIEANPAGTLLGRRRRSSPGERAISGVATVPAQRSGAGPPAWHQPPISGAVVAGFPAADRGPARARESLAASESLHDPNPGDLYNMACACALVSALLDQGAPEDREKLEARAVGYLRRAIEGDPDRLLPQVPADRDLDPLRRRADFRDADGRRELPA